MEFPPVFIFEDADEGAAARELAGAIDGLGIEAPYVLHSVHGATLARGIGNSPGQAVPPSGADQEWASTLGSTVRRSGAGAIVAIGGGRCLDVAKLAAARAGVVVVGVPTQLSHDGICSPVAVVPNSTGRTESLGAIGPRAVFVSIPTVMRAPAATVAAGLGDLLANPLALRDWSLAAERGLVEIDHRAWDLSVESYERIESHLDADPASVADRAQLMRELADALVLSGMAMICAGTSRPASGGEHEISHAIDQLHAGRAMHGAQVAFGCIVSVALYGEDTDAFRARLRRLGLPHHPADLGLAPEDVVRILLEAPETRAGRFTILEDADLDEDDARATVAKIWADD
ncbi:MAG: iron-containing alcohol dehydrogenase [Actinomycetota bacterium]